MKDIITSKGGIIIQKGENLFDKYTIKCKNNHIFKLYLNIDNLYTIFATESFLLIFWIHFVSINIFVGSWVAIDGAKHNMSRVLVFFPLILIYLSGIIGIVLYWLIRVFYAKKLV